MCTVRCSRSEMHSSIVQLNVLMCRYSGTLVWVIAWTHTDGIVVLLSSCTASITVATCNAKSTSVAGIRSPKI